jgi:hypothetical protein
MLEFLDFQVNVCPGQAGRIKAIEVTGRMTGKRDNALVLTCLANLRVVGYEP